MSSSKKKVILNKFIKQYLDNYITICKSLLIGRVIIIETDTLIALISLNKELLYKMKNRPLKKKLISFVGRIEQIPGPLPADLISLLKRFWPGSLTVIYKGIAYRMPKNPIIIRLCEHLGPLHSTSANISGSKPIKNLEEARDIFRDYKDDCMIVHSGCNSSGIFSTIYNYDSKEIIREGEISKENLFS